MQTLSTSRRRLLALFAASALGWRTGLAYGDADAPISILLSAEDEPYRQAAEALKAGLGGRSVRVLPLSASLAGVSAAPLVVLGYKAAQLVARGYDGPVLAALLPRAVYQALLQQEVAQEARRRWSGIVLDQPWSRQVGLIRLLLPRAKRIGLLLSAANAQTLSELGDAAAAQGMALDAVQIDDASQMFSRLRTLLAKIDVLLAVPDRDLINRNTLEGYLMSAYRAGIPVIGYSPSMVDAGALAAVYSAPEDVGRQLAEILDGPARGRLSALIQPAYFKVKVNRSVARSLELPVAEEDVLARLLLRGGG